MQPQERESFTIKEDSVFQPSTKMMMTQDKYQESPGPGDGVIILAGTVWVHELKAHGLSDGQIDKLKANKYDSAKAVNDAQAERVEYEQAMQAQRRKPLSIVQPAANAGE